MAKVIKKETPDVTIELTLKEAEKLHEILRKSVGLYTLYKDLSKVVRESE